MIMIVENAVVRSFRKAGAFWTAIAYINAMGESRRALSDINAMEDHLLQDIGLTRADVMRANVAEPGSDRMTMLSRARSRRMA